MTIAESLKKYSKIEADLLLAHVLQKPKEFLYVHREKNLTAAQERKFIALAAQRRRGVPIAYLLGYKDFYGLRFTVNKSVLIPRPESEWLVDQALKIIKPGSKVLDVGTGSGCLAISIRKNVKAKHVHVWASDVSAKALIMAKANARHHKTKVKFYQSDLFKNVPTKFNLIIANLPYVPITDYKKLRNGLKHEPKLALTDGTDHFQIYERFLSENKAHLKPGGVILLEIDPSARSYLKNYARQYLPNKKITFHKDLRGLWRYAQIN